MACERYANAIQELADGTLGPIRRAELDIHLDECEACRRLADDLVRIRTLASSLERMAPPNRVWLQIAGRLRQEGRIAAPPPRAATPWRFAPLAIAASLLLVIGTALYQLYPRGGTDTAHVTPHRQRATSRRRMPSKALKRSSGWPSSITRTPSPSSSRPRRPMTMRSTRRRRKCCKRICR